MAATLAGAMEHAGSVRWTAGIAAYGLRPVDAGATPDVALHVLVFEQATLILEAASPSDGRVAWRGKAVAGIDPDLPLEERASRLRDVVERILEQPPCHQPKS